MSTIYQKPTGVWYIQWMRGGRRVAKSLGTRSHRAAKSKQAEHDEQQTRSALGLPAIAPQTLTVARCCTKYSEAMSLSHALSKSSLDRVAAALGAFALHYGHMDAGAMTPRTLKEFQSILKGDNLSRRTINDYVGEVRRLFKWLASEDIVPASVALALTTVSAVRPNDAGVKRTTAPATVPQSSIDAIRAHVPSCVWAMVQLQLHTAARPGEIVGLRPCDIDTSGEVWVTRPAQHKTAHKGKARAVYFGPAARKVLKPYLSRVNLKSTSSKPDAGIAHKNHPIEVYKIKPAVNLPIFSPREAAKERAALAKGHRRPNQKPNPRLTSRRLRDAWTVNAYRKCIAAACLAAEVPVWTPNELRHTAATRIREKYGIEAAQVFLGHSTLSATQIYAEVNDKTARKIAKEIG